MDAGSLFFPTLQKQLILGKKISKILTLETNTKFGCHVVCQGESYRCLRNVLQCAVTPLDDSQPSKWLIRLFRGNAGPAKEGLAAAPSPWLRAAVPDPPLPPPLNPQCCFPTAPFSSWSLVFDAARVGRGLSAATIHSELCCITFSSVRLCMKNLAQETIPRCLSLSYVYISLLLLGFLIRYTLSLLTWLRILNKTAKK